jgi:hypothetical protein
VRSKPSDHRLRRFPFVHVFEKAVLS